MIYRAKFVPTVFAARQFINHGHINVNGRRVNIASYQVKVGDLIEIKESSKQLALVLEANALAERDVPDYVEVDHAKGTAKLTRIPGLSEVPYPTRMEPNLVIEFYSRLRSVDAYPLCRAAASQVRPLFLLEPSLAAGPHAVLPPRNCRPWRRALSGRGVPVCAQRRARQMAGGGLRRRAVDDAALDRRRLCARGRWFFRCARPSSLSPRRPCTLGGSSAWPPTRSRSTGRRARCRSPT